MKKIIEVDGDYYETSSWGVREPVLVPPPSYFERGVKNYPLNKLKEFEFIAFVSDAQERFLRGLREGVAFEVPPQLDSGRKGAGSRKLTLSFQRGLVCFRPLTDEKTPRGLPMRALLMDDSLGTVITRFLKGVIDQEIEASILRAFPPRSYQKMDRRDPFSDYRGV